MNTLASILRAQLATGRPLRVTRALLEALDDTDSQLALAKAWGLEAWEAACAAETHIAELDALVPCDDFDAPPLRTMASPERQKVAGWAIATCARVMRGELDAHPEDTRNRLTIGVVWDDERWSLTLARGDYEHAMEAQRNEARGERDEERARANEWLAKKHDTERERDEWRHFAETYRREREEARQSLRERTAERDEARRELSEALGLPPSIGPAPGEAVRIVRELRESAEAVERERDEARRERDAHASRNRGATQRIIEAIGSVGPESVEDAVPRVLAKLAEALRNAQAWADERDVMRRECEEWRAIAAGYLRERDALRLELAADSAHGAGSESRIVRAGQEIRTLDFDLGKVGSTERKDRGT